jgi:diguanylate cyclase (GGDEF)-like protein/putative nucleotidyltransferase with HDIG domain
MGPAGILAVLLPSVCAVVLACVGLLQHKRIKTLRTRIEAANRTDPLTGLLNRRAFEELLELELDRATRAGRPLSVVVGDIDGFRAINERQGHAAGDAILQSVAENALKWKRRIDHAARIGGEEFALLLPETDERGSFIVAERLRRAVHRSFVDSSTGVNFSFGVATAPSHGEDAIDLLRAADSATAAAKDLGGDRTVIYSDEVARTLARMGHASGELQLATVIALAEALDIRDTGTGQHSHTVGRYAELMARALGFDEEHVERVRLAGILHDIGKIGITESILCKQTQLTPDEMSIMREHPAIGASIVGPVSFLGSARDAVRSHHEKWNGTGYPEGLKGQAIPLIARVVACADTWDACTSTRPYQRAMGAHAAMEVMNRLRGVSLDPDVVDALARFLEKKGAFAEAPPARAVPLAS